MKKQRKVEKDNRGVAIYARKSRITNKGDSIGVQFKQCADYAKKELGLDEDYEFLQYEDKGLSGYFSDRPDFQRMLHDVQDGKIKAIVERIYIVDKDDERYCHIFIKGCSGEDYTGFFQTAGYIEQNTVPVCDSEQYCICTKISETSNIWTDSDRYREHPKKTVRV